MEALEIAIAGCGPGGLAAALLLDASGHRVTLFERFDAPRPLGSGLILQPTGLAVLDLLGLGDAARGRGARIERLFGRAVPSGRVVLDVRYSAHPDGCTGVGIHRATLFDLLYREVLARGIAIRTGHEVQAAPSADTRRMLQFSHGDRAGPFHLVVDALGTQSVLAPGRRQPLPYGALWTTLDWCGGFDPSALEQRYRRASRMVGVLPIGRLPGSDGLKTAFFWSLRGDELDAWRRGGLDAWKSEVLGLWPEARPLLAQIEDPDQLTFARYCHRTYGRPAEPALVHLGDSWHSTSPQLGQGANMALLDAAALGAALSLQPDIPTALRAYTAARRRHVRAYQAMSYVFTPFYQSAGRLLPLVRDYLAAPLSRIPPGPRALAWMVSGSACHPLRRIGMTGHGSLPIGLPRTKASAP